MSLGEIHGRLWSGKRFQCCGKGKSDFLNFSKHPHHSRSLWIPNSSPPSILPLFFLTYILVFLLSFITCIAWHHLHILPLKFHHTFDALRAGNERCKCSAFWGHLTSIFFCHSWQNNEISDSVTNFHFPTPGKRKQRPHAHCSSVKQKKPSSYTGND